MGEKGKIAFINIQGWMIYDLNLSGNELLLFALIFGYTQDGKNEYHGSLSYIQNGLQLSRPSVIALLKKLLEKGYISKVKDSHFIATSKESLLVKKVYHTSKETLPVDGKESLPLASKETLPNNNNTSNNTKDNIYIEVETKKVSPTIQKGEKFLSMMKENLTDLEKYKKDFSLSNQEIEETLKLFFGHWTEKSPKGLKERWEKETTFDINLRFYKWLHNQKNWSKPAVRGSGITSLFDE